MELFGKEDFFDDGFITYPQLKKFLVEIEQSRNGLNISGDLENKHHSLGYMLASEMGNYISLELLKDHFVMNYAGCYGVLEARGQFERQFDFLKLMQKESYDHIFQIEDEMRESSPNFENFEVGGLAYVESRNDLYSEIVGLMKGARSVGPICEIYPYDSEKFSQPSSSPKNTKEEEAKALASKESKDEIER